MIRSLYTLGGLFALTLILFAQAVNTTTIRPERAPTQSGSLVSAAPALADPATAIEDLAAWPVAAGR